VRATASIAPRVRKRGVQDLKRKKKEEKNDLVDEATKGERHVENPGEQPSQRRFGAGV